MEPIEDMWQRFTLSDKEGLDVDLAHTQQQFENILVAKFLTPRVLNIDSVARTFKPLWKTKKSFSVQDLGRNRAAFVFDDEVDLERVLANEPWSFDKFLVVFQRLHDDIAIDDLPFSHTSFWVQIHNLPVRRRTEDSAAAIGRTLGQVERVADQNDERGGENCMRVRVRMDITTPLCRGRMIRMDEGKKGWVAFRYERLSNFCYWCGHLDHAQKDCDEGLWHQNSTPSEELQYGPWLRAEMDRPPRKTVVVVPGNLPRARAKPAWEHQPRDPTPAASEPQSPTPVLETESDHTPDNAVLDMEIEENPGIPSITIPQKSNSEKFADQLREIDEAINFIPTVASPKSTTPNLANSSREALPVDSNVIPKSPPQSARPRGILSDITNGPSNNTSTPKPRTAKWKKLARAHVTNTMIADLSCPLKRSPLLLDPDTIQGKKIKPGQEGSKASTTFHREVILCSLSDEISVVAGLQRCRQP